MKINAGKCHLFVSGNKNEHTWAKIDDKQIWESRTVYLLGNTIDNKLKFDEYISHACEKAQRKLTVLRRIKKYLDFKKLQLSFKTFFDFQFKFCSFTWMFYRRIVNNKINTLHERVHSPLVNYPQYIFQKKIKLRFFYLDNKVLRKGNIVKYTPN